AASRRAGRRVDRRLAGRSDGRARARPRRRDSPLPLSRSVVAELAAPRARDHRRHRAGFSADQQIVQPELLRAGSLMWQVLRQIGKAGLPTEAVPPAEDAWRQEAQAIAHELLAILGRALAIREVDAGSCNGCELEIHAL